MNICWCPVARAGHGASGEARPAVAEMACRPTSSFNLAGHVGDDRSASPGIGGNWRRYWDCH
ncbi:MAG: hypothetical protein R3F36_03510 [Candidatus Competibacteraceae bacterium]